MNKCNYTIITVLNKYLIQLYLYVYLRYTYKYMSTYTNFHTKFEINNFTCIYIDYTYIYMGMNKAIVTINNLIHILLNDVSN